MVALMENKKVEQMDNAMAKLQVVLWGLYQVDLLDVMSALMMDLHEADKTDAMTVELLEIQKAEMKVVLMVYDLAVDLVVKQADEMAVCSVEQLDIELVTQSVQNQVTMTVCKKEKQWVDKLVVHWVF